MEEQYAYRVTLTSPVGRCGKGCSTFEPCGCRSSNPGKEQGAGSLGSPRVSAFMGISFRVPTPPKAYWVTPEILIYSRNALALSRRDYSQP